MIKLATPIEQSAAEAGQLTNFLADNIRLLRKRMGLSQQDLAEKVGLNRGNIASYESATAEPKICKLLRISNFLRITTRDLTRLNLSEAGRLEQAMRAFEDDQAGDKERIELLLKRVEEIEVVMQSVKNLYNFRAKGLDLLHPDVKAMAHYYEQMYSVTETLLEEHRGLLNEMRCQCRS